MSESKSAPPAIKWSEVLKRYLQKTKPLPKEDVDRIITSYISDDKTLPAINDHVCPCCGNDRVSKSETSCWKCGGRLH